MGKELVEEDYGINIFFRKQNLPAIKRFYYDKKDNFNRNIALHSSRLQCPKICKKHRGERGCKNRSRNRGHLHNF